jgi:hypothetical protein
VIDTHLRVPALAAGELGVLLGRHHNHCIGPVCGYHLRALVAHLAHQLAQTVLGFLQLPPVAHQITSNSALTGQIIQDHAAARKHNAGTF